MRTLILAPFDSAQLDRLRAEMAVEYESWLDTRKLTDPQELARRVRASGIPILVVEADFVFEETFDDAPGLRFLGVCRATTDHIDIEAATRRGVVVVNTPARNARAVAEHALGLMFSLARNISRAHSYVASGQWSNPAEGYISMRGVELRGRTIGIIGLGAIGAELTRMCVALDMNVVAHDPYIADPPPGVRLTSLEVLASISDFISVHVPARPGSARMIGQAVISRMKPSAFLVSCSDPAVMDQRAVAEALASGRIAGAAFDVFDTHPIAPSNPLLKLDNVVLTPHIGGATVETIARHSEMMADDILRFKRGERPLNLVNPRVWTQRPAARPVFGNPGRRNRNRDVQM